MREKLKFYASLLEAIYGDRKDELGLPDNLDGQIALQEGAKALRKVSLFQEEISNLKNPYEGTRNIPAQSGFDTAIELMIEKITQKG